MSSSIDRSVNKILFSHEKSSERTLECNLIAKCSTSRARVNKITLCGQSRDKKQIVDTPVFMPVGTQGTMKGITTEQMKEMFDCRLFLGNTYHLGHRPGPGIMKKAGGLHKFMKWNGGLLTDSGGFQMVSLAKLSYVTEEGVNFTSPHDESQMLLTPEHSMEIQNAIGADIMMQLDDVISSLTVGPRVEEATYRSIRWLDRCIEAHKRPQDQALFAIVQGGLSEDLRVKCLELMLERQHMVGGFAIGGLSGGEKKDAFWRMVDICCKEGSLPVNKPRYVMGVGYSLDILVCVALGADMFDCVYPTRTGRFGCALVPWGNVLLSNASYKFDFNPIDKDCKCIACTKYTRAYLHSLNGTPSFASLISIHNVAYMLNFMRDIRSSIIADKFPEFCRDFFKRQYSKVEDYPIWALEALENVNIVI